MASLVADYGISSDSEDDQEDKSAEKELKTNSVNYLGSGVGPSFSSSEESDDGKDTEECGSVSDLDNKQKLPNPMADRLPPPGLVDNSLSVDSSVFVNRYAIAEQARKSVLEKHVKMTEHDTLASMGTVKPRSGKQVCHNFKKGKCRYGDKCKYSHSDEVLVPLRTDGQETCQQAKVEKSKGGNSTQRNEDDDEDSYMAKVNFNKKKRAGKSNSLIPPKRAMQELSKERVQSRPWTMPN